MSIRFAAASPFGIGVASLTGFAPAPGVAANDNGGALGERSDKLIKAALRHFAQHGLSAAEQARMNAEEAFFAGKSEEYRWWLAICAALDRRMAAAVEFRNHASGN